jgi:hypothetical protein
MGSFVYPVNLGMVVVVLGMVVVVVLGIVVVVVLGMVVVVVLGMVVVVVLGIVVVVVLGVQTCESTNRSAVPVTVASAPSKVSGPGV